ncbi:hypothetical protein M911_09340 [Ectothiorhodospira haloalkaliphila]|uniref:Tyr recombinase domain-containing protein n=1 Tax=Ectothiorhodospira haloalkaliphila TaxID=421628 RepID=W8L601_9GAMM|nr:tyrosine-type recombinase/integrase [Ectothiorhodospira haloalkaliphila]AHK79315.1 hypothetical protein M911_09340 [Ectothiorhodospira haloalkaliphila]
MTDEPDNPEAGNRPSDLPGDVDVARLWARWRQLWAPYVNLLDPVIPQFQPVESWSPPAEYLPVLKALHRSFPLLAQGGGTAEEKDPPEVPFEFGAVITEVGTRAPAYKNFITRWRALEVLDAGNRLRRWNIPVTRIPAPLPTPTGLLFSSQKFEAFVAGEPVFDAFMESITDVQRLEQCDHCQALSWGRLLFSLISFSGVFDSKSLLAVPQAMFDSPAHGYWLDISVHHPDQGPATFRRYFLDPISRHLLLRQRRLLVDPQAVKSPFKVRNTRSLYRNIIAYADAQGFANRMPKNWAELKSLATTRLSIYVPAHLVGFAKGYYASASLPVRTLDRLFNPPKHVANMEVWEETEIPVALSPDSELDESDTEGNGFPNILHHALVSLLDAINDASREASIARVSNWVEGAKRFLDGENRYIPASVFRLSGWVLYVLNRQKSDHCRELRANLYAIAPGLVGQMGWSDFTEIQAEDDFIAIYTNVLDEAETGARRKRIVKGLRSFHEFLVEKHGVPPLDESGMFSQMFRQPHSVDANFVDPDTFDWICRYLRHTHVDDPEKGTIRILIAVLGYFSGLRRSEAVGLCVGDFDGPPEYTLVVNPNKLRSLKTDNANRVLPIRFLVPKHYLELLIGWIERQKERAVEAGVKPSEKLLFSSELQSARERKLRQFDLDLDAVTQALVRMSGDRTLRFHHFRHSFAQRMLMGLWYYENQDRDVDFQGWFGRLLGLESACHTREQLLGKAKLQRRSLRLISMLLGHSTTDITMNHYIHCADLLLGRAVRAAIPDLRVEEVAALAGVRPSTVYDVAREMESQSVCDQLDALGDAALPNHKRLTWPEPMNQKLLRTPEDAYEELLLRTEALNHRVDGVGQDEGFVYPYPPRKLDAARAWLADLPEHFRMSTRGAGAPLLEPPRTQQDRNLARRLVHLLLSDPRLLRSEQLAKLAAGYISGKLADHPMMLVCDRIPLFNLWWRLFSATELQDDVELLHLSTPRMAKDTQLAYWRKRMPEGAMIRAGGTLELNRGQQFPERGAVLFSPRLQPATRWKYGFAWAMTCVALDRLHWRVTPLGVTGRSD